jgi:hypothetical protein
MERSKIANNQVHAWVLGASSCVRTALHSPRPEASFAAHISPGPASLPQPGVDFVLTSSLTTREPATESSISYVRKVLCRDCITKNLLPGMQYQYSTTSEKPLADKADYWSRLNSIQLPL